MDLSYKDLIIGLISPLVAASFVAFAALNRFKHEIAGQKSYLFIKTR